MFKRPPFQVDSRIVLSNSDLRREEKGSDFEDVILRVYISLLVQTGFVSF